MILALLLGCTDKEPGDSATTPTDTATSTTPIDSDGDGYSPPEDCNDEDRGVNPLAAEKCNDADDDCDGEIDEEPTDPATWYVDEDGDGYGAETPVVACDAPKNAVGIPGDCDDTDEDIRPGAVELCEPPGVDEDCDGDTDEDCVTAMAR